MNNEWLKEKLSDILQFPVPEDMVEYISSITNVRDLEDYMKTLIDFSNPHHKRFLQELLQRRQATGVGYKKNEVEEMYIAPKAEKKKKEKSSKADNFKKEPNEQQQTHSKKKKYVNLYSQDGRNRDVVLLKGRHKCECQASKHRLINNCLKCGRIVCEQEGSGPCLFCGNLVCSREEQEVINEGTKHSSHLLQKLMDQKVPGLEAAIEQRNRLLEYDRNCEMRTQVIDDENDYFTVNNVWLSPRQREELKKKEEEMQALKHRSQMTKTYTLDMTLKQMIQGKPDDEFDMSKINEILREINKNNSFPNGDTYCESDNIDPASDIHPKFDDNAAYEVRRGSQFQYSDDLSLTKVQDREYLEMVDEGLCMSLHQPWASLLVCGVKLHEGRNWYTSHRGRLWIASAVKQPTDQEIRDMEKFYESIRGTVAFPLTYPTGCLLGCVNIVNCLPQEEYALKYPNGESSSPFVFICGTPQELPIHFPISGKHKIFKLEPTIHKAALKAFQRLAKIKADKNCIPFIRNS